MGNIAWEYEGCSRLEGNINKMKKRTLFKERKINKRSINFLNKQNIEAPHMYGGECWKYNFYFFVDRRTARLQRL